MRTILLAGLAGLALAIGLECAWAAGSGGHRSCTDVGCPACVPVCRGSWKEEKTKKPAYSMKCEYACARGRDSWHAPEPECRCTPPCGNVFVKKRLYKTDGREKVEKVPKYEVQMVPAPATCGDEGCCWWNPFALLYGGR